MQIYLATPHISRIVDITQEDLEIKLDYIFNKERTTSLLEEKKVFLIDTFDTFVQPADYYESIIIEREGIVAYLKTKEIRTGFREFLKHYKYKEIGIHSDSLSKRDFQKINNYWQLDNVNFFGYEYSKIEEEKKSSLFLSTQKDFEKMIDDLDSTKTDTLIIGDGFSDIKPAYWQNIDLLLVPSYRQDKSFDFRKLHT